MDEFFIILSKAIPGIVAYEQAFIGNELTICFEDGQEIEVTLPTMPDRNSDVYIQKIIEEIKSKRNVK